MVYIYKSIMMTVIQRPALDQVSLGPGSGSGSWSPQHCKHPLIKWSLYPLSWWAGRSVLTGRSRGSLQQEERVTMVMRRPCFSLQPKCVLSCSLTHRLSCFTIFSPLSLGAVLTLKLKGSGLLVFFLLPSVNKQETPEMFWIR